MMDWNQVSADLEKKLDPKHVKPPRQYGPKGDYIEGWHAIAEANRIFGFGGWSYDVVECRCVSERPREIGQAKKDGWGVTYIARVRVLVAGVARDDVGAGHGYDVDCGLAHESAIKEAVTDALKRSLRTFGSPFGLALYDKSRENVGVDLPPFDAAAARDRIKRKIEAAQSVADLAAVWKGENEVIKEVGAASASMEAELVTAKDARKAALTQKEAA